MRLSVNPQSRERARTVLDYADPETREAPDGAIGKTLKCGHWQRGGDHKSADYHEKSKAQNCAFDETCEETAQTILIGPKAQDQ